MPKRGAKKGAAAHSRKSPISQSPRHEAGALPPGWALARLGDVTVPKVEQAEPEGREFRYIDIASVDNRTKRITEATLLPVAKAPSRARQRVKANDVLVSLTRPNLNAVALVPSSLDGATASTGFDVLRGHGAVPEWLMTVVRSRHFVDTMSALVQGALYPAVRPTDVRAYELPLPPLAEQKRILGRLSALQTHLGNVRTDLGGIPKLLAQARQSVLAAAFHGKLTADWRAHHAKSGPPKHIPIPDGSLVWEVPKSWRHTRLCNLLTSGGLFDGPFGSKLKTKDYTPSGVRVIRLENIGHLTFDDEKQMFVSTKKHKELEKHTVGEGDIIFSSFIFEPLRVCILPPLETKALAKADCFCIRPDEKLVTREFLALQLASPNFGQSLKELVHGATRPRVNTTQLRITSVAWCPLPEQREIVRRLHAAFERLDATAAAHAQATAELDRLEQTILAKAFRGGLVPQSPEDEPANELLTRIRAEREAAAKAPQPKKPRVTTPSKPAMPLLDLIHKHFGKKPFTFESLRAEATGRPYDELKQTLFELLRPAAGADPVLTVRFNDEIEAMEFTLHKP